MNRRNRRYNKNHGRGKGWYNNIPQHRLAGMGISTKHKDKSNFVKYSSIDVEEFQSYFETQDWVGGRSLNVNKEKTSDRLVARFKLPSNLYSHSITSVQSLVIFNFSDNKLKGQIRFPFLTKDQFKEIEDDVHSIIEKSNHPLNFEAHLTPRGDITPHSFFEINKVNTNYLYEYLEEIGDVINEVLKEYPNEGKQ